MTDPGRLLTALTTEHFTLSGQRAATTSEGATRSSLFLGSVTSALLALGFLASVTGGDSALFRTFALTVLPTLCFLGIVTSVLAGATFALARFLRGSYGMAPTLDEPMFPSQQNR